jgi:hypothetical protein
MTMHKSSKQNVLASVIVITENIDSLAGQQRTPESVRTFYETGCQSNI